MTIKRYSPSYTLTNFDRRLLNPANPRLRLLDCWPSMEAALMAALVNIDNHDKKRMLHDGTAADETPRQASQRWLARQSEKVRQTARKRPLNAIYLVEEGVRGRLTIGETGLPPLGTIAGYREHGGVVYCGFVALGLEGAKGIVGAPDAPFWLPPRVLTDVTDRVRRRLISGLSDANW